MPGIDDADDQSVRIEKHAGRLSAPIDICRDLHQSRIKDVQVCRSRSNSAVGNASVCSRRPSHCDHKLSRESGLCGSSQFRHLDLVLALGIQVLNGCAQNRKSGNSVPGPDRRLYGCSVRKCDLYALRAVDLRRVHQHLHFCICFCDDDSRDRSPRLIGIIKPVRIGRDRRYIYQKSARLSGCRAQRSDHPPDCLCSLFAVLQDSLYLFADPLLLLRRRLFLFIDDHLFRRQFLCLCLFGIADACHSLFRIEHAVEDRLQQQEKKACHRAEYRCHDGGHHHAAHHFLSVEGTLFDLLLHELYVRILSRAVG